MTIGTVSRAYAEAQRRHLISGEVGRGSFVLDPRAGSSREQARAGNFDSDLLGLRFGEPEEDGGLIDFGDVAGVEILQDKSGILVETHRPDEFYARLPELSLSDGTLVREVYSDDDNLEAVFRYLVTT